ncbi:MAG: hypothetical protein LBD07_03740 [Spirochaetaceae bacterium]|jgi:hypothetical protein|nr:hypothetical protein [Spirochaetaceae bacterium]
MGLGDKAEGLKFAVSNLTGSVFIRVKTLFSRKDVLILIAVFAFLGVLSVVSTIIFVKVSQGGAKKPAAPLFRADKISGEDIFLPNEPDFLPEVLFEQEQKKQWTQDDAEQYWTDPREFGGELLQEKMSGIIDKIMERIP